MYFEQAQRKIDKYEIYKEHYLTLPAPAFIMTMNAFDIPHLEHLHNFTNVEVVHSSFERYAFICYKATMPGGKHNFMTKIASHKRDELIVDNYNLNGDYMYTTIETNENIDDHSCKHKEIFLYNTESPQFNRVFMESVFKAKQPITREDEDILDQVSIHIPESDIDPILDNYIKWYQNQN